MRTPRIIALVVTRASLAPGVLGLAALIALAPFVFVVRDARAQTPTGTATATPERRLELAPIESVEVQVLKSQPPQYQVAVTSGLPGGCAQFDSIKAERSGTRVDVTVMNSMPVGNVPCTAIYGYKDSTLNLGADFAAGTTYTVVVNAAGNASKTTTFTAQSAGTPTPAPADPTPTPALPATPRPANVGTGGPGVDALDAIVGGSALLAAILAASVVAIRVPRRRG